MATLTVVLTSPPRLLNRQQRLRSLPSDPPPPGFRGREKRFYFIPEKNLKIFFPRKTPPDSPLKKASRARSTAPPEKRRFPRSKSVPKVPFAFSAAPPVESIKKGLIFSKAISIYGNSISTSSSNEQDRCWSGPLSQLAVCSVEDRVPFQHQTSGETERRKGFTFS